MRNKLITFSYTFCLYLAVIMIPFERWIDGSNIVLMYQIIGKFFLFLFIIYDLYFVDKREFNKGKFYLLYIPLIVGLGSNWLTLFTNSFSFNLNRDPVYLILNIFNTVFVAFIEEIIFRELSFEIFNELFKNHKNKDYLVVLCSALAFSLGHAISFIISDPLVVLTQIGYTFILGLILGSIRIKSNSILICVVGHFLFNFLNSLLFTYFISIDMNYSYYLISLIIGVISLIYTFIICFIKKGKNIYAS